LLFRELKIEFLTALLRVVLERCGFWIAIFRGYTFAIERAVQDGDLPAGTDCATLAR
jgi:hypothetical protein